MCNKFRCLNVCECARALATNIHDMQKSGRTCHEKSEREIATGYGRNHRHDGIDNWMEVNLYISTTETYRA